MRSLIPALFSVIAVLLVTAVDQGCAQLNFTYHDFSEVETYLKTVNRRYPDITHLYSIGRSVRGRSLWVLAIASSPQDHVTLRPNVKYVGNMHGDEAVGRELLLHFIELLVTSYNTDPVITRLLRTTRIHILVTLNPDGFETIKNYRGNCQGSFGRYNARFTDLNRNFPDYFSRQNVFRQPETRAVMSWSTAYQFVLSANLHGGAIGINYPYDTYAGATYAPRVSRTPDDDVFIAISRTYANAHPTMAIRDVCNRNGANFDRGITNGANWYPFTGGMQDYNYVYAGCMEVSIELSCCKFPAASSLPQYWRDNKDALLRYISQVHMGVKGMVYSSYGQEIKGAKVRIRGREQHWVTTTPNGEFWRLLRPGSYLLQVSADGFRTKEQLIKVYSGRPTVTYIIMAIDTITPTPAPPTRALG